MSNEFIVTVVQKLVTVVNREDVLTKDQAISFVKNKEIGAFRVLDLNMLETNHYTFEVKEMLKSLLTSASHALKFNSGCDESSGNYTYTIDAVTKEE